MNNKNNELVLVVITIIAISFSTFFAIELKIEKSNYKSVLKNLREASIDRSRFEESELVELCVRELGFGLRDCRTAYGDKDVFECSHNEISPDSIHWKTCWSDRIRNDSNSKYIQVKHCGNYNRERWTNPDFCDELGGPDKVREFYRYIKTIQAKGDIE